MSSEGQLWLRNVVSMSRDTDISDALGYGIYFCTVGLWSEERSGDILEIRNSSDEQMHKPPAYAKNNDPNALL